MATDTTVHRGEVVEAAPVTAIAAPTRDVAGVMALAMMPQAEFEARLHALKQGQERIRIIQRELMEDGEDYGKIPGTDKPTLLKPGAEKLCAVYGLKATFSPVISRGDGMTEPHLRVLVTCQLHQGDANGPVVAEGYGASNSWEKKHRYRSGKRVCPACGVTGSIRKSKFPDRDTGDIGWWCREESCKTNFTSDDPSITEQVVGEIENPDPFDVENTLVKMALKRAFIDTTLRATATSGLFTQDLEDQGDDQGAPPKGRPAAGSAPHSNTPAPAQAQQPPIQRHEPPPARNAAPPPAGKRTGPQANGKWQGPCPRCKKEGAVIQNKRDGHGWFCWPNASRVTGCGYKWDEADVAIHEEAESRRAASGDMFDGREG